MGIKGLTKLLSDEAPDCLKDVSIMIAMGGCVDWRVRKKDGVTKSITCVT